MKYVPKILVSLSLCAAVPAFAADVCAVAGNLVANCGFESGSYTSTLSTYTNTNVPNSWTPNQWFDYEPGFNGPRSDDPYSGVYELSIGNYDYQNAPTLSQTLTDVSGSSYSGSLYAAYIAGSGDDPNAFFDVQINGVNVVALTDSVSASYALYTFNFTGTGSDTLTLTGNTNPAEWYVDSVVVTGAIAAGTTPEPSSLLLLGTAAGPLMWLRRKFVKR